GGSRAAALPDDGVEDRAPALAVPDHRGLALVGEADRGDLGGVGDDLAEHLERRLPDLVRVVLHPAGLRIDLAEFGVGAVEQAAALVDGDRADAGGSLVDGDDAAHFLRIRWME